MRDVMEDAPETEMRGEDNEGRPNTAGRCDASDIWGKVLGASIFPLCLWLLIWGTGGFAMGGPRFARAISIWAVLYVPAKIAQVLIHKESGLCKNCTVLVGAVALVLGLLWLIGAGYALVQWGLMAIPGIVIFGYLLFLVWCGISGEEP